MERAQEIASAAREVTLPAHARELVEQPAAVIDDLATMVDPPEARGF